MHGMGTASALCVALVHGVGSALCVVPWWRSPAGSSTTLRRIVSPSVGASTLKESAEEEADVMHRGDVIQGRQRGDLGGGRALKNPRKKKPTPTRTALRTRVG